MKKTIGGDRLGSGKKMQVDLHGYERSTHDLGYLWRSTMSAGTLVPFMSELALPGDTFDINLDCDIKTHPTIGPLFGSYKVQLDVFQAPIRLYHALLHNNTLGIGLNMSDVKLPLIRMRATHITDAQDVDNSQINPSCIFSYFGIRGVGQPAAGADDAIDSSLNTRYFNAIPWLAYWEVYKNYYANKQEEIGAVIHTSSSTIRLTVTSINVTDPLGLAVLVDQFPNASPFLINNGAIIDLAYSGGNKPYEETILFRLTNSGDDIVSLADLAVLTGDTGSIATYAIKPEYAGFLIMNWRYQESTDVDEGEISVATFPLENIDEMRSLLMTNNVPGTPYVISLDTNIGVSDAIPYVWPLQLPNGRPASLNSQEGLAVKTYQSDLLNNWIDTEFIDHPTTGINAITAIDTSGGSFSIDTLNLSKKVYDMLNRIAISGGSYDDWLDAVYAHDRYTQCYSPMYLGGLIKELVFQEVVSNAGSDTTQHGEQPLGTLAGRGVMAKKHKGGRITVKVDEPSYIIGIISLTPRLDYSQGNKWDMHLLSMDDLHKPGLDGIGFQELITEQMAWWDTKNVAGVWEQNSAGKQPAWINYMTNVNQVRGNFAIAENEMFMTLNRRYEMDSTTKDIQDLTTYIDPAKFNHIFAQTALDAQNFWAQIAVDITARRKMSARVMPNL